MRTNSDIYFWIVQYNWTIQYYTHVTRDVGKNAIGKNAIGKIAIGKNDIGENARWQKCHW